MSVMVKLRKRSKKLFFVHRLIVVGCIVCITLIYFAAICICDSPTITAYPSGSQLPTPLVTNPTPTGTSPASPIFSTPQQTFGLMQQPTFGAATQQPFAASNLPPYGSPAHLPFEMAQKRKSRVTKFSPPPGYCEKVNAAPPPASSARRPIGFVTQLVPSKSVSRISKDSKSSNDDTSTRNNVDDRKVSFTRQ
uniref:Uncharacterized protein n=1 Tax=Romanomermis culicivorax TaxID=13658 RepID=A0A915L4K3_ROMCU